ncbi:hypothetical protein [Kamptonema formosum]|uniref:hypothetical protein n=1 Tax=Kamptonema formosum TaxID=331992 RepID=UPI00035D5128|nr:hypothetical protein [Oscillatoria sp. PCC 10802]
MNTETNSPLIEEILSVWQERIGDDYPGYRGHVYRMFNFCLALRSCTEEENTKLAIAACFHDIGLWSDHTVDYISPSVAQVKQYLSNAGLERWSEEIGLMVEMHHKVRPYRDDRYPLVELFRQGDLIDFSLGFFTFGLPRRYVNQVKETIPNNGFHKFLIKGAKDWFSEHPFSPPPFMKW